MQINYFNTYLIKIENYVLLLISQMSFFPNIYNMENEVIFILKERELKKNKVQKIIFVSTVISVSAILLLNLISYTF